MFDGKLYLVSAISNQVWKFYEWLFQVQAEDPQKPGSGEQIYDAWTPCGPGDRGAIERTWMDVPGEKLCEPPVDFKMISKSLQTQKKTVNDEDLEKLHKFASDFGQDGWKNIY